MKWIDYFHLRFDKKYYKIHDIILLFKGIYIVHK